MGKKIFFGAVFVLGVIFSYNSFSDIPYVPDPADIPEEIEFNLWEAEQRAAEKSRKAQQQRISQEDAVRTREAMLELEPVLKAQYNTCKAVVRREASYCDNLEGSSKEKCILKLESINFRNFLRNYSRVGRITRENLADCAPVAEELAEDVDKFCQEAGEAFITGDISSLEKYFLAGQGAVDFAFITGESSYCNLLQERDRRQACHDDATFTSAVKLDSSQSFASEGTISLICSEIDSVLKEFLCRVYFTGSANLDVCDDFIDKKIENVRRQGRRR